MSIAVIHDRIMDPANIESAPILLPSGRRRKQNLRIGFRAGDGARGLARTRARGQVRTRVCLFAGSGYLRERNGCPLGRSGRPFRRRGDLPVLVAPGALSARRGCPSGGQG
jgi:hypothetical protein